MSSECIIQKCINNKNTLYLFRFLKNKQKKSHSFTCNFMVLSTWLAASLANQWHKPEDIRVKRRMPVRLWFCTGATLLSLITVLHYTSICKIKIRPNFQPEVYFPQDNSCDWNLTCAKGGHLCERKPKYNKKQQEQKGQKDQC